MNQPQPNENKARFGDPFIPTPTELVRAKLEFGELCAEDTVFDLGCGDARVLIMAAEEFGAKGVGVEVQQGVAHEAWSNVADHDLDDLIEIRQEDYLETDLSEADLVVLYMTTRTLHAVSDKLKELPPGARIVTHDFPLPQAEWPLSEQSEWSDDEGQRVPLYLYRKG